MIRRVHIMPTWAEPETVRNDKDSSSLLPSLIPVGWQVKRKSGIIGRHMDGRKPPPSRLFRFLSTQRREYERVFFFFFFFLLLSRSQSGSESSPPEHSDTTNQ